MPVCVCAQACLTLCKPLDYNPAGSSVHGISQARILECIAAFCSRGSSQSRDWTHGSCIADGFFAAEPLQKPEAPFTNTGNTREVGLQYMNLGRT